MAKPDKGELPGPGDGPDSGGDNSTGRIINGIKFSKKLWAALSQSQKNYIASVLGGMSKAERSEFMKVSGVHGGVVNGPDLTRFMKAGILKGNGLDSFLEEFKAKNREDYEGPRTEDGGDFETTDKINITKGDDYYRIQGILKGLSPANLKKFMRGGSVSMIDMRRLYRGGVLGADDQAWLEDYLKRNRMIDDKQAAPGANEPSAGGGGDGGFGGGGGGGGHGGGGGGKSGKNPYISPGDPDPFDPEMWDAMKERILQMLTEPGYPPEVLAAMQNVQRAEHSNQLRDQLQSSAERMAERGLSESGLAERRYGDIEATLGDQLADNLAGIDLENARAAIESIKAAFGGALGMDEQQLARFELELRDALQELQGQMHSDNLLYKYFQSQLEKEMFDDDFSLRSFLAQLEAMDFDMWRMMFTNPQQSEDPFGGGGTGEELSFSPDEQQGFAPSGGGPSAPAPSYYNPVSGFSQAQQATPEQNFYEPIAGPVEEGGGRLGPDLFEAPQPFDLPDRDPRYTKNPFTSGLFSF